MKILIFNPSFLGDSILTTPLIQAVKNRCPEADISFCVRPEYVPLFDGLPFIKEVIPFDKRGDYQGLRGIIRFAKVLEQKNFDMVITPHKSFRTNLTLYFAKIPRRIGFVESAFSALLTASRARYMDIHEVQRNLALYEAAFDEYPGRFPLSVYIDPDKRNEFSSIGKNLVGLAPGSVWATKMWPAERFAAVADWLYEKGHTPVIIGSPDDSPAAEAVVNSARNPIINMCGKTNLRELPALISNFSLMITNDSGPMHIAVATGVKCVAIFGPTVKGLGFTPYDEISLVAEAEGLKCRPCGLHGHNKCPKKHFRCMLEVTPENVISLIDKKEIIVESRTAKYETVKAD